MKTKKINNKWWFYYINDIIWHGLYNNTGSGIGYGYKGNSKGFWLDYYKR